MIQLTKLKKPDVLAKNEDAWRDEYVQSLAEASVRQTVRDRHRHPEIKQTIRREAHDKCAYCESKIGHSQPGDTEHIHPVSKFPALIVSWENLTLACRVCNTAKSDYYNVSEPIIHPYDDDPEAHIVFLGQVAYNAAGDDLGLRTIRFLKLNRTPLLERRNERLQLLKGLVDRWARYPPGNTKDLLKKEIIDYACCDKEFSSLIRWFLRLHANLSDEEIATCSPSAI